MEEVKQLIVFHEIGVDSIKDSPWKFKYIPNDVVVKCIPTDKSIEERLEIIRSIPNTLDFFLFYDGKAIMCDRKGKGFVRFHMRDSYLCPFINGHEDLQGARNG